MASGKPYTSTFAYRGRIVTVAMTEPQTPDDVGVKVGLSAAWPGNEPVQGPTVRIGYLCPATFRVDGLPYGVTFTIDFIGERVPSDPLMRITTLSVTFDGVDTPDVVDIPTKRLLTAAVEAAEVWGLQLPPGGSADEPLYPALGIERSDTGVILSLGSTQLTRRFLPLTEQVVPSKQKDIVSHVAKGERRRNNAITPDLLRQVADVHRDAEPGTKQAAVARFVGVGQERAKQLIRAARNAGYLPDLSDTDKRKQRRKETT